MIDSISMLVRFLGVLAVFGDQAFVVADHSNGIVLAEHRTTQVHQARQAVEPVPRPIFAQHVGTLLANGATNLEEIPPYLT